MLSLFPTRRVLIADDDLEVRRGVVDLLTPLGLEIFQAESGLEVLEIVRMRPASDPLHLLLLDMHMPGCSGLEVLAALRARVLTNREPSAPYPSPPGASTFGPTNLGAPEPALTQDVGRSPVHPLVPCIFYSGNVTQDLQRKALEAGAWAFLRKPVQPDVLRSEVLRALAARS